MRGSCSLTLQSHVSERILAPDHTRASADHHHVSDARATSTVRLKNAPIRQEAAGHRSLSYLFARRFRIVMIRRSHQVKLNQAERQKR